METTTIFKASLKLIKEGRFHSTSMAEIGYHANVSASTVEVLFESRDRLIEALANHIYSQTCQIIESSERNNVTGRERFMLLWERLYNYYVEQEDVIFFLDQFNHYPQHKEAEKLQENCNTQLMRYFSFGMGNMISSIDAQTITFLFHENIKTAVKLSKVNTQADPLDIARLLWNGLNSQFSEVILKEAV